MYICICTSCIYIYTLYVYVYTCSGPWHASWFLRDVAAFLGLASLSSGFMQVMVAMRLLTLQLQGFFV